MDRPPGTQAMLENPTQVESPLVNMVAFEVEGQAYTLPIDMIYRIIEMVYLTQLPELNESIEGIFNYHGTTVPVVNLRTFLHQPRRPIQLHTPIILVEFSGHILGLIVDRVIGVISRTQSSIHHPKDLMPNPLGEISILDGLIQDSENYLLMLNLEQLLTAPKNLDFLKTIDQILSPQESAAGGNGSACPEAAPGLIPKQDTPITEPHHVRGGNGDQQKALKSRKKSGHPKKRTTGTDQASSIEKHEEGKD